MNDPCYLILAIVLMLGRVSCGASEIVDGDSADARQTESRMTKGFSWVLDESLGGMPAPGLTGALESDYSFLKSKGIDVLVTLTQTAPDVGLLADFEIESAHLPVKDFTAPSMEQLQSFVALVDQRRQNGEKVGVHCRGGMGRTGTFLAAYFVSQGMSGDEAIGKIRELRPGSIETEDQEEAVRRFQLLSSSPLPAQ